MPRRTLYNETFYHIYNRGNHKQAISWDDEDKDLYLFHIEDQLKKKTQELLNYCIMDNHYHFSVKINHVEDFIMAMHDIGLKSSKYFNKKYDTAGHLFQGRYQQRMVEGVADLVGLSRYIHLNPKDLPYIDRNKPEDFIKYRWSSLNEYVNGPSNDHRDFRQVLSNFDSGNDYLKYVFSHSIKEDLQIVKSSEFQENVLQRAYEIFDCGF